MIPLNTFFVRKFSTVLMAPAFLLFDFNPLFHNVEKWPTYFKILLCLHRTIFKVYLAIFQHYETKG